jgi:hypothetical protein
VDCVVAALEVTDAVGSVDTDATSDAPTVARALSEAVTRAVCEAGYVPNVGSGEAELAALGEPPPSLGDGDSVIAGVPLSLGKGVSVLSAVARGRVEPEGEAVSVGVV